MQLLAEGKVDAFGFPPEPQELRARKIGHVIVNSAMDKPWSQYFCCMVAGNREFVRKHPVATKRALRAILKAADSARTSPSGRRDSWWTRATAALRLCAPDAEEMPYDRGATTIPRTPCASTRCACTRRDDQVEPQKIIAQGTDWRFLNELKKELKG